MPIASVGTIAKGFGSNGYTTGAIDTTGANLLVWTLADNNTGGTGPTLTDDYSNTWTLGQRWIPIGVATAIYYCENPIVGSGHTFTCAKTGGSNSGQVRAYSGAKASGTYDQDGTRSAFGAATVTYNSITPTEDDELVVAFLNFDTAASLPTINSSFINPEGDIGSGGTYLGSVSADLIQTTAAALTPTWTHPSSNNLYAIIATFRADSVAPSPDPYVRPQLAVYRT